MSGDDQKFTATDIIRSMKRLGYPYEEIYDTLTGTGIPGGEVQLLMDRVETDFEDTKIEDRSLRLSKEVDKNFKRRLKETKVELKSEIRKMTRNIKSMEKEIEDVQKRIIETQKSLTEIKQKRK